MSDSEPLGEQQGWERIEMMWEGKRMPQDEGEGYKNTFLDHFSWGSFLIIFLNWLYRVQVSKSGVFLTFLLSLLLLLFITFCM